MAKRRLTQQQRQRIALIQERRLSKATGLADSDLIECEEETRLGRVITRHGSNLLVEDETGRLHHCLFRQNLGHVVCGDQVVWQPAEGGRGVVTALRERTSLLARPLAGKRDRKVSGSGDRSDPSDLDKPLAANITRMVIVLAPEPAPLRYLLDQYLITSEVLGIEALICLNKTDLMPPEAMAAFDREFADYPAIGYPLIKVSASRTEGLQPLVERMTGQTSILLGQSGVGKSSLASALLPDREIQTGRLALGSGHGCHTTSTTTLYHLPGGGELIDSPGVRSFRPILNELGDLERGFREFAHHLGHCRFNDCRHRDEPGCALVAAVERGEIDPRRLDNFRHMATQFERGR